jgi:hypothetical protein
LTQAESLGKKQVATVLLSLASALTVERESGVSGIKGGPRSVRGEFAKCGQNPGGHALPPAMATWKVVLSSGVVRSHVLMLRPTWTR